MQAVATSSFGAQEWLALARAARQRQDPVAALQALQRAAALQPGLPTLPTALAQALRELGRLKEAECVLHAALTRGQGPAAGTWLLLSRLQRQQGGREAALASVRAALRADPAHLQARATLVDDLLALSLSDEAQQCLQQWQQTQPDQGLWWRLQSRLDSLRGDDDAALASLRRAVQLSPPDVLSQQALVGRLLRRHALDDAGLALQQAQALLPSAVPLRLQALRLAQLRGDLPEALALAELLVAQHPGQWEALNLLFKLRKGLRGRDAAAALLPPLRGLAGEQPGRRAEVAIHASSLALMDYDLGAAQAALDDFSRLQLAELPAGSVLALNRQQALVALMAGDAAAMQRAFAATDADRRRRGLTGVSHGLMKQIWREFATNPFAQAATVAARPLPVAEQAAALARAHADEPGDLAVAMAWLVALRRLRAWPQALPTEAGEAIPRRIMQFWDTAEVPPDVQALQHSWPAQCEGFACERFNDATAEAFVQAHADARTLQAFRLAHHAAMRSDLFRLVWLLHRGGVYADSDDRCLASVGPWLAGGHHVLLLQEDLGSIGNNFMAAAPGHPLIAAMLAQVVDNVLARQGDVVWFISGPGALTGVFCRVLAGSLAQGQLPPDVQVMDTWAMGRHISMHLPRHYKRDARHWGHAAAASRPLFKPRQVPLQRVPGPRLALRLPAVRPGTSPSA